MSGALIEVNRADLTRLQAGIDALLHVDLRDLLGHMAGLVEAQTRRRIAEDKSAPEGTDWPAWSAEYAATRGTGQALLQGEGDLLDSITHEVDGEAAEIGTNLIYAATHQFGDEERGIPARAFLGISPGDAAELARLVVDYGQELAA